MMYVVCHTATDRRSMPGTPTRQAECRQAQGIEVGTQAAAVKPQLELALVLGPLKLHPAVAALQHNYR